MKLSYRYFLADKNGAHVLEISADFSPKHMLQMRDVYAIIYPDRAPLKIMSVDILGDEREVRLYGNETDNLL